MVHCAHCGIRFLTHPRNAGRINLRCPFGCSRHHRRRCSSQRSADYYRTPAGKLKKRWLNARRPAVRQRPTAPSESRRQAPPPFGALAPPEPPYQGELRLNGVVLDEPSLLASPMLSYARMVVSLVEGVPFSLAELVRLLRRALRQHSIGRRRRTDYVLHVLHQRPP